MNSYPQPSDNLWTTRRCAVQVIHILISNLTRALPSRRGGEPLRRLARSRVLVVAGVLCLNGVMTAYPSKAVDNTKEIYKLYAHTKLLNAKEFHCVDLLWTKESQWNPRSDNKHSTAFGIPQLLKIEGNESIQANRSRATIYPSSPFHSMRGVGVLEKEGSLLKWLLKAHVLMEALDNGRRYDYESSNAMAGHANIAETTIKDE